MQHIVTPLFNTLLLMLLGIALSARISQAHVSADDMPDSVAEVEYSIYLEFKPQDTLVRNKLGMVFYRLNKLEEAVREFSRVLKQKPENYDALDGMGLVKTVQGEYDAAIGYHRQAIALNGEDMTGYYHLGSALERKGALGEALEAYRMALARYTATYPFGTENAQAAEFGEKVRAAIRNIEDKQ